MRALIAGGVFAAVVFTAYSTAAPLTQHSLSEQEVLTFVADTIDWCRHLASQRIGTEPADLLFIENNRPTISEIVRLSFEFGKAAAAIVPTQTSNDPRYTSDLPPIDRELQDLMAGKARLDANIEQVVDELNSITGARFRARESDRKERDNQKAEMRNRIELLKSMSANYEELAGFVRTASAGPARTTSLATLVGNLETTVPDVLVAARSQTPNTMTESSQVSFGITGMISRISTLARKEQFISGAIERTDALTKSSQNLRTPLAAPFRKQFSTLSSEAKSLKVLEQQQSRLADLVVQAQTASPAIAALIKQQMLMNVYRSHLAEWRSDVHSEYRAAWRAMLVRLGVLAAVIAMLLGTSIVVRRTACRHVRDADTRHVVLIGERVLLTLILSIVILFAFAFDLNSLATFLGLLSAGLAVGLHDVLLAVGGYVVIVRRFHIRLGDRVQISGVTGEVTRLGLIQFELSEIDATHGQQTGRIVFFSNSFVFVSPATPFFRQLGASG